MTNTEQVVVLSSVCGKHFDDGCPSCQSAKESNDRRLSRNTPADSEVERVARAIWREDIGNYHGPRISFECWPEDYRNRIERMARAAIASLSPKPVDGEVAELVDKLLNLHERMHAAVRKQRPYPVKLHCNDSDTDAVIRAAARLDALSRNTEPMGASVAIQIIAQSLWQHIGPAITAARAADVAREVYLALSAGEKGTDPYLGRMKADEILWERDALRSSAPRTSDKESGR